MDSTFTEEQSAALQQELVQFLNASSNTDASGSGDADIDATIEAHNHNDLISGNSDAFEAEDYTQFSNFIPNFVKPDKPCEYCRSKGLECYMHFGSITCKACDSLFRNCSFARVTSQDTTDAAANIGALDTLHVVQEDICAERGARTGVKQLRSKAGPARNEEKRPPTRFSKENVKILRDWFEAHINHPYPTEAQKVELENATGLKYNQITTWLANTRRRTSSTAKSARRARSPDTALRTQAINVPAPATAREWQDLNPFERWQHSPPENEPAPIEAIADAVKCVEEQTPDPNCNHHGQASRGKGSSSGTSQSARLSARRAPSATSVETGRVSTGRVSSTSNSQSTPSITWSAGSHSSLGSFNSFGSGLHGKRDRRRKRKIRATPLQRDPADEKKRIFQCTFCCDSFKTKYDWTRHEKTLHLSLEKWICAPLGPIITDPHSGNKTCVYCHAENPTKDHVSSHNHNECECKGIEARTFYRKDHLRQHLRLMHHCDLLPFMESWKASADYIKSRCGFCDTYFSSWSARNDHLAAHYKSGANIKDWTKCRGFDPEVAANVTNAMPPYLIGMERESPNPFSATNNKLWHSQEPMPGANPDDPEGWPASDSFTKQCQRSPDRATCWEIMTIALGRYVKEMSDRGIPVSDEMIQTQARRIIYDDEDAWNQTAADNPEWLDLFKKAHGMNMIPAQIGGVGEVVPDDVELYIDLGIRIPFSVQQKSLTEVSTPSSGIPVSALNSTVASVSTVATSAPFAKSHTDLRTGKTYMGYSSMPILAERAAHFTNWTAANPIIPLPCADPEIAPDGLLRPGAANFHLAREGDEYSPSLSPEQEAAWQEALQRDQEAILASHMDFTMDADMAALMESLPPISAMAAPGESSGGSSSNSNSGARTPSSNQALGIDTPRMSGDMMSFDDLFDTSGGTGTQDEIDEFLNMDMIDACCQPAISGAVSGLRKPPIDYSDLMSQSIDGSGNGEELDFDGVFGDMQFAA